MDHPKSNGTEAAVLRIGEERAAKILERAAALDATRSSEIELDQLREAAAAAGISHEAFDQAMAEIDAGADTHAPNRRGGDPFTRPAGSSGVSSSDFAHYTAVLRDIMGDEGQVSLVEDRIEWQDKSGITVSVSPSSRGVTTAVAAEGRLMTRMKAAAWPLATAGLISFLGGVEEDEILIAFVGFLLLAPVLFGSIWWSHRREQRKLRKKADSIRRQLQRLVVEPPQEDTASRIARLLPRGDRMA